MTRVFPPCQMKHIAISSAARPHLATASEAPGELLEVTRPRFGLRQLQQFRQRLLSTKRLIVHQLPAAHGIAASCCWKRSAQRARFQLRYQLRATHNACELSNSRDQHPLTSKFHLGWAASPPDRLPKDLASFPRRSAAASAPAASRLKFKIHPMAPWQCA